MSKETDKLREELKTLLNNKKSKNVTDSQNTAEHNDLKKIKERIKKLKEELDKINKS